MDSFPCCTKNGNREESFKADLEQSFTLPFRGSACFPSRYDQDQTDGSFIARKREINPKGWGITVYLLLPGWMVKRRGMIVDAILGRNITPTFQLFRSSKLFDSEDNKIFSFSRYKLD